MNAFERHGITHLSPSSTQQFASDSALWVMTRLLKRGDNPVGAAAHRGTAAEAGIVMGLADLKANHDACVRHALRVFDKLTAFSPDARREQERKAIDPIVRAGLAELRQYGVPSAFQNPIERWLPGVPVKWTGFSDVEWSNHGIVLDIKTTLKLPADVTDAHARQVGLYIYATDHEGRVAYLTPAKVGVYTVKDAERHIAALVNIAQRMERFLSISDDPKVLAGLVCPDLDSFHYSNPRARAMAAEVFGFT